MACNMVELLDKWIQSLLPGSTLSLVFAQIIILACIVLFSFIVKFFTKKIFHSIIIDTVKKTKNTFDDHLVKTGILAHFYRLVPLIIIYFSIWHIFPRGHTFGSALERLMLSMISVVVIMTINNVLDAFEGYYQSFDVSKTTPIKSYLQLVKIFLVVMTLVFVISTLINKSPWGIISSIGAMTAIILLIFKDWILGLVASIQINTNDIINIGDWIEMPKYNADGDVIDISLINVRVRNFDKTITSIPTYALTSESFINWRGMKETGARRIKRLIFIDVSSITFCDRQLLARLKKINLLHDFITEKEIEIRQHNSSLGLTHLDHINGRHLTNIGLFREYVLRYLQNHKNIEQSLTMMVRQKEQKQYGLPVEIYAFINDTVWQNFEAVQGHIFDHILSIVPYFNLRLYQSPSGHDLQVFLTSPHLKK